MNSNIPKVSVVIPVYNCEKYLRECLDSVINQSLRDIEIICVDDGSTDNSHDILLEYQKKDNRITVLFQTNQGAGAARNQGLDIARGEFVAFLDADDFFKSDMLEKSYVRGIKAEADIVMYRFHRYDNSTKTEYDLPHMMNKSNFPNELIFSPTEVKGNLFFTITGWTWDKLFSRKFIKQNDLRFQKVRIYNDMFFTFSAISVANKISYINDALVCQRVNREGAISGSVQKYWYCIFSSLNKLKEFLLAKGLYDTYGIQFVQYASHMLLFTYRQLTGTAKSAMQVCIKYYSSPVLNIDFKEHENFINNNEQKELFDIVKAPLESILQLEPVNRNKKKHLFISGIKCINDHGLLYTIKLAQKKIVKNVERVCDKKYC